MLLGVPFLLFGLCIPCMLTQLSNGVCIVPGVELIFYGRRMLDSFFEVPWEVGAIIYLT